LDVGGVGVEGMRAAVHLVTRCEAVVRIRRPFPWQNREGQGAASRDPTFSHTLPRLPTDAERVPLAAHVLDDLGRRLRRLDRRRVVGAVRGRDALDGVAADQVGGDGVGVGGDGVGVGADEHVFGRVRAVVPAARGEERQGAKRQEPSGGRHGSPPSKPPTLQLVG